MTTDHELRDLLLDAAQTPSRHTVPWEDVVRRGRHHRRVARLRTGLTAGGLAALAVLGVVAVTDLGDDEKTGVVANDPVTATTRDISQPDLSRLPDLTVARAGGSRVTLILGAAVPDLSFDPCTEQVPVLTETAADVTIGVAKTFEMAGVIHWPACQSSPFSTWATIELDEPLGSRPLIDAKDGKPIHVVDEVELLFPSFVPAPFDIEHRDEFGPGTYEGVAVEAWTFSWSYDDLGLSISRWAVDGEHPEGCGGGEAIEVRGVSGYLCGAESGSLLSWVDGDSMRIIELVDVSGEPLPEGIDLIALAEGLEPLG